jgi:hypothetical protein
MIEDILASDIDYKQSLLSNYFDDKIDLENLEKSKIK